MLYSQIPIKLKNKLATELKIDLKLISATFKEEPSEGTLYSKLEIVKRYLLENEKVGTITKPAKYFQGKLECKWLILNDTVFFGTELGNTVLGLAGSAINVINNDTVGQLPTKGSRSHLFAIMQAVEKFSKATNEANQTSTATNMRNVYNISVIFDSIQGPTQRIEFLAKKLLERYDRITGKIFIIGSPIYVALEN